METPQEQENASIEKSIKKLNVWLGIMVGFMIIYSVAMLAFIDQKTERALRMHPVVMIDPATLALTSDSYTNLIHPMALRPPPTNNIPSPDPRPMFEQKESYEVGDFVVVNYFYVETIVVEKLPKDCYRLMYKDHEHVLQTIDLHKQFLLAPTSYNVVSPVSLLVD